MNEYMINTEKFKKILVHILIWFAPSSTPIYIITHELMGYEMLPCYFIACAIPCIIAYPIEAWVMEKKHIKRKITAKRIR